MSNRSMLARARSRIAVAVEGEGGAAGSAPRAGSRGRSFPLGERHDQAAPMAVLGDMGDAGRRAGRRRWWCGRGRAARPSRRTCPPVAARMPASTSSSSDWPLPATPAMPRISPARTVKLTAFSRATPLVVDEVEAVDLEHHRPGAGRGLLDAEQDPPTDHQLGELGRAGLGGGERPHHLAPAHDADLVGHRHDLAQLVGDQDDRLALGLQVLEDAEQVVGLGRGQHAGRLVEDQDVALAVERLQDLDPLLQPDRKLADDRVRDRRRARIPPRAASARPAPGPARGGAGGRPRRRG